MIFENNQQHDEPFRPCEGIAMREFAFDDETSINHGIAKVTTFARMVWM